jgi:two-component system phosphate regulon sensor histidine kinase PhoR
MQNRLISRLLILGALAIGGIIFIQNYWVVKNWDLEANEFHQTVTIALRKVAESIADFNQSELPKQNLIQRRSSNYYAVNINDVIDANILEDYLVREFENHSLNTDFEYAVYDCSNQELVYGNYCKLGDKGKLFERSENLPKFDDLIYYFVVKFPHRSSYLISSIWQSILFSVIAMLAVLFFIYAIWVILKQKRLSEMQKDFINNMTHEFKTPISSIKIASEVLSNDSSLSNNERLQQYVGIIQDQNQRLNAQVERVLSLARLEKQSFRLEKEIISLHGLLDEIILNENIRLKNEREGNISKNYWTEDILITADKVHFSNLVYNILDNAVKYSKNIPHIEVQTRLIDKDIFLTFKDNGIGISKENLPKIFKKFYRVPTGNIHNVKGFGLGLFYVKNICEAHKWKIDLVSELNKGSTVTITIPN